VSLTPAELAAARAFRGYQRRALEMKDANITADVHVRYIRHDCAKQGGKSVSLELREHYVWSLEYESADLGTPERSGPWEAYLADSVPWDELSGRYPVEQVTVPAKRFGWIFTAGKCQQCGMTARSGTGRLVDPETRPPSEHAIVAGGTG
jgi:hypothetical protein